MPKIIRIALLFVVLAAGFVSTAPTQVIEARTTRASEVKPPTLFGCPLPIPNCIPEKVFDFKTCGCVARP
jgi:hypothetical protein